MSTLPEIVVGHFHVQRSTKTLLFLFDEGQAFGYYFQVWSPYYQVAQCNQ